MLNLILKLLSAQFRVNNNLLLSRSLSGLAAAFLFPVTGRVGTVIGGRELRGRVEEGPGRKTSTLSWHGLTTMSMACRLDAKEKNSSEDTPT